MSAPIIRRHLMPSLLQTIPRRLRLRICTPNLFIKALMKLNHWAWNEDQYTLNWIRLNPYQRLLHHHQTRQHHHQHCHKMWFRVSNWLKSFVGSNERSCKVETNFERFHFAISCSRFRNFQMYVNNLFSFRRQIALCLMNEILSKSVCQIPGNAYIFALFLPNQMFF